MPLEIKNTQTNENRRLGFIKSLNMQKCTLCDCESSKAVLEFQSTKNGLNDPKGNKNIICAMVKYGETFYGRLTIFNTNCSGVK